MALDGIVLANIRLQLEKTLLGGKIDKIYEPETDEIILYIRSLGKNYKLLMTANPGHPRLHLTQTQKDNPANAPSFCMVLRKHLVGGKIIRIEQPNFERILNIYIESLNEMGDMTVKRLIIEIMGKHSNIILTDESGRIINPVKNISHEKSSVREVLPGKQYVLPPSQGKLNPLLTNEKEFLDCVSTKSDNLIQKIIYTSYTGISPLMASEICYRAGVFVEKHAQELDEKQIKNVYIEFNNIFDNVKRGEFVPCLIFDEKSTVPLEFGAYELTQFGLKNNKQCDGISDLLDTFYSRKDSNYRIKQKTHDLRRLIQVNIERCVKKSEIQQKTIKDVADMDKWRLCGELITSNIYNISKGMTEVTLQNFYSENLEDIKITLDPTLTPVENQQRYFAKYNKAKRTLAAIKIQSEQNKEEMTYLESLLSAIDSSFDEADITQIREEMLAAGYVKKRRASKGSKPKKAKPYQYKSSDGFDIYVGKNNVQNDELTLRFAVGNDYWFHTKEIPGSHVIVKTNGQEIPSATLNEAAILAAFYSRGRTSGNVPVDYCIKKHVKKPSGARPGMVIYDQYKTAYVTPSEEKVNEIAGRK